MLVHISVRLYKFDSIDEAIFFMKFIAA
jgi:hypothetical protein